MVNFRVIWNALLQAMWRNFIISNFLIHQIEWQLHQFFPICRIGKSQTHQAGLQERIKSFTNWTGFRPECIWCNFYRANWLNTLFYCAWCKDWRVFSTYISDASKNTEIITETIDNFLRSSFFMMYFSFNTYIWYTTV